MINDPLHVYLSYLSKPVLFAIVQELSPILERQAVEKVATDQARQQERWEGSESNTAELDEGMLKDVVQEWLTDKNSSKRIIEQLSSYERSALEFFIYHVGRDFLSFRQIDQGIQGLEPHSFRLGLIGLRRKGIIYTIRRQWGEEAYVLPPDLEELFYKILLEETGIEQGAKTGRGEMAVFDPRIWESDQTQILSHSAESGGSQPFYHWMFFMLDNLRQIKDRKIPLTQKGTIHKRYVRLWEEKWVPQGLSLQAYRVSSAYIDTYSHALAVILDFFTRQQILLWDSRFVMIDVAQMNRFMANSRKGVRSIFLQYWFQYYTPESAWMQSYHRDARLGQDYEGWVPILQFVERWESQYNLPAIPEMIRQIKEDLLEPLFTLGLIEYGKVETGELVWRWCPTVEASTEIWVQPNFEGFCSGMTPLSVLWRLTELFSFEQWDHLLLLRLSEQKVQQAIEAGINVSEWLDWLNSVSKVPVPSEIEQHLLNLRKRTHQVSIDDVTLLNVNDPHLLQALVQYCHQQDIVIVFTNGSYVVVEQKNAERLQSFFTHNQISVRDMRLEEKVDEENQNLTHQEYNAVSLLLSFKQQTGQLKVESVFPAFTDAIPAWNQLPDMWKKQMAVYHENTKRTIIEKAIKHHLDLKFETPSGTSYRIKPVSFQVSHGEWVCLAANEENIPFHSMTRMQLLFPVPEKT